MDKKYLLGVDIGTSSIKVVIIDENAKPLGISSSSYRMITPDQNSVQIDMEDMWNAYLKCIRLLQEGKKLNLSKVAGISIFQPCPDLWLWRNWRGFLGRCFYLFRQTQYGRSRDNPECSLVRDPTFLNSQQILPWLEAMSRYLYVNGSNGILPEAYEKHTYFGHLNTFMGQADVRKICNRFIPMRSLTLSFLGPTGGI